MAKKLYKRGELVAARAIDSGQTVSIGDYRLEYPEAPENKPYSSLFAIPLIENGGAVGALSLDSSRPYFFQSFSPGVVEDHLENSLAPYTQTILCVLQHLLVGSWHERIAALEGAYADEESSS